MAKPATTNRAAGIGPGFLGNPTVPNLDPFFQASNKLIETWMVVGTEILEFSKSRIDQSLEMGKAMAQSTTLNEAMDLQQKFTRTMVQDCIAEANKIADLSTRSILDSFSTMQGAAANSAPPAPREAAE